MMALSAESTHKFTLQSELKQCSSMSGNTLAKYLAGFSAHLMIVRSANSKSPDVSLFTTCTKTIFSGTTNNKIKQNVGVANHRIKMRKIENYNTKEGLLDPK